MCFGPLQRLCHWGPLTALAIIKLVTYMTVHCTNMWWPPHSSLSAFLNISIFLIFSALSLYNFLSAIFEGPGYLPLSWLPECAKDEAYLQFCSICQGFKAPRAHHCRKCGRCVLKMDHHCPWINNCVGHANHAHFALFLFFSVCGCSQSLYILSCSIYRGIHRVWYMYHSSEPSVQLTLSTLALSVFALGLSIGVVIAVGMLFYFQMRGIVRNRTGIEEWIYEKAEHRRSEADKPFAFPYDLGWRENLNRVFRHTSDGITWPLVAGCHQYTLTIEQREQKSEKRLRTRAYSVMQTYSGWWCPVVHGWRVLVHLPLTDEPRIELCRGETVLVTRWRRYWLFGERNSPLDKRKNRGWFPRCCVVEISEGEHFLQPRSGEGHSATQRSLLESIKPPWNPPAESKKTK